MTLTRRIGKGGTEMSVRSLAWPYINFRAFLKENRMKIMYKLDKHDKFSVLQKMD